MGKKYMFLLLTLISMHVNGQVLFSKCFQSCGPPGAQKTPSDLILFNSTNDIFISGRGEVNNNQGFISKCDSLSNLVWSKEFQNNVNDTIFGLIDTVYKRYRYIDQTVNFKDNSLAFSIVQDIIVYKKVNNNFVFDHYGIETSILNRIDTTGSLLWSKSVNFNMPSRLYLACATSDRILFSGFSKNTTFQLNSGNQFLYCTDSSGIGLWNHFFTGTDGRQISKTKNYFNQGFLVLSNDSNNLFLMKLDDDGVIEWSYKYSTTFNLSGTDLHVASDSSIYVLANNDSTPFKSTVIKLDQNGQLQWSKIYGSSFTQIGFQFLEENSDTLKLLLTESTSVNGYVIYVKLDSNGNILESNVVYQNSSNYSPTSQTYSFLLSVKRQGSFFVGIQTSMLNFPSFLAYILATIRFDATLHNCDINNFTTSISSGSTLINAIPFPVSDSTVMVSLQPYTLDLIPETFPIVNFCTSSIGLDENEDYAAKVELYPNPTSGTFTIKLSTNILNFELCVFDLSGRQIYKLEDANNNELIDIALPGILSNGMYNLRLVLDGDVINKRLILMKD